MSKHHKGSGQYGLLDKLRFVEKHVLSRNFSLEKARSSSVTCMRDSKFKDNRHCYCKANDSLTVLNDVADGVIKH